MNSFVALTLGLLFLTSPLYAALKPGDKAPDFTTRATLAGKPFQFSVSHDSVDKLNKCSIRECRNKFAVASDADQGITKAYDAVLHQKPEYANRTSYVIAPDGSIIYENTALDRPGTWEKP
jgi:peroxiredoxin